MSRIISAVAAALLAAAGVGGAQACSCARTSLAEKLDRSTVVAVVRVESLHRNPDWPDPSDALSRWEIEPVTLKYQLIEVFKGAEQLPPQLGNGLGGGDCGIDVHPGQDVLLLGTPHEGRMSLSLCSGTTVLGLRSVLSEAGLEPRPNGVTEAKLHAVRRYVLDGEPIHACVADPGIEQRPSGYLEEDVADCRGYFESFEQID